MLGLVLDIPSRAIAENSRVRSTPLAIVANGANGSVVNNGNNTYTIKDLITDRVTAYSAKATGSVRVDAVVDNRGTVVQYFGLSYNPTTASSLNDVSFGFQVYADGECYLWTGATGNNGFTNRVSPNINAGETLSIVVTGTDVNLFRGGAEVLGSLTLTASGDMGFISYGIDATAQITASVSDT